MATLKSIGPVCRVSTDPNKPLRKLRGYAKSFDANSAEKLYEWFPARRTDHFYTEVTGADTGGGGGDSGDRKVNWPDVCTLLLPVQPDPIDACGNRLVDSIGWPQCVAHYIDNFAKGILSIPMTRQNGFNLDYGGSVLVAGTSVQGFAYFDSGQYTWIGGFSIPYYSACAGIFYASNPANPAADTSPYPGPAGVYDCRGAPQLGATSAQICIDIQGGRIIAKGFTVT